MTPIIVCTGGPDSRERARDRILSRLCAAAAHSRHAGRNSAVFRCGVRKADDGEPLAFLEALIAHSGNACVLWPYASTRAGYPIVSLGKGKNRRAHRYLCELVYGPPHNQTLHCAHSCGQRRCVNPRHLRWATALENAADKQRHGTETPGLLRATNKLTPDQVRELRRLRREGVSWTRLAKRFGIGRGTTQRIVARETWRWLDD